MEVKRVLVVDDEEFLAELLQEELEEAHWSVDTANSAEQARKLIENNHYEFLITDVQMPGGSGLELSRLIKKLSPSTSIIVISGRSKSELDEDSILEKVEFVEKPFSLQSIVAKISS